MLNTNALRSLLITEKAMKAHAEGVYTFKVNPKATKEEIKKVVETIYAVEVEAVNTCNQSGKTKISRGRKGQRADFKKAFVKLKTGFSIDTTESV